MYEHQGALFCQNCSGLTLMWGCGRFQDGNTNSLNLAFWSFTIYIFYILTCINIYMLTYIFYMLTYDIKNGREARLNISNFTKLVLPFTAHWDLPHQSYVWTILKKMAHPNEHVEIINVEDSTYFIHYLVYDCPILIQPISPHSTLSICPCKNKIL